MSRGCWNDFIHDRVCLTLLPVSVIPPPRLSPSRSPPHHLPAIAWAKQTGDIAVLSKADISVLALTYACEVEENGHARLRKLNGEKEEAVGGDAVGSSQVAAGPSASTSTSGPSSQPSASTSTSSPAPTAAPTKASPWASFAKPTAHNLADDAFEDVPEEEAGWAEEGEREEMGRRLDALKLGEEDQAGSESESESEEGESRKEEETKVVDESPVPDVVEEEKKSEPSQPIVASSSTSTPPVPTVPNTITPRAPPIQVYQETTLTSDDDEDAGEWITPSNVASHKTVDLGLAPPSSKTLATSSSSSSNPTLTPSQLKKLKKKQEKASRPRSWKMRAACMTGDYAVQNVLMQMGLNLVGEEGKRIEMVKSWVLRCHACFK